MCKNVKNNGYQEFDHSGSVSGSMKSLGYNVN